MLKGVCVFKKNATLWNYSIGHAICTVGPQKNSRPANFSLVVGQDLYWQYGELNPNGGHVGCPNDTIENMFVGGNITISEAKLIPRRRGPCTHPGCLDVGFDLAYLYFKNVSARFSATKDNAKYYLKSGGELVIQPFDATASRYYISFNTTILEQIWSVNLKSTNPNAQLIFSVTGDSGVIVQFGAPIIMNADKVLWNIPGKRSLVIRNGLNGSVLAPDASCSIVNGAVNGYFITSDITSANQMNSLKNCFTDKFP